MQLGEEPLLDKAQSFYEQTYSRKAHLGAH